MGSESYTQDKGRYGPGNAELKGALETMVKFNKEVGRQVPTYLENLIEKSDLSSSKY